MHGLLPSRWLVKKNGPAGSSATLLPAGRVMRGQGGSPYPSAVIIGPNFCSCNSNRQLGSRFSRALPAHAWIKQCFQNKFTGLIHSCVAAADKVTMQILRLRRDASVAR